LSLPNINTGNSLFFRNNERLFCITARIKRVRFVLFLPRRNAMAYNKRETIVLTNSSFAKHFVRTATYGDELSKNIKNCVARDVYWREVVSERTYNIVKLPFSRTRPSMFSFLIMSSNLRRKICSVNFGRSNESSEQSDFKWRRNNSDYK